MKFLRHEVRHWRTDRTRGFILAGVTGPDTGDLYRGEHVGFNLWKVEKWHEKTRTMRPVKNQDHVQQILALAGERD